MALREKVTESISKYSAIPEEKADNLVVKLRQKLKSKHSKAEGESNEK